jgi:hypothetical protein
LSHYHAHGGGGEEWEEGGSCIPSKDFKKLDNKNKIKTRTQVLPSKEFENDLASIRKSSTLII